MYGCHKIVVSIGISLYTLQRLIRETIDPISFPLGQSMSASADQNLLFGILALQMDFITRDQLVSGLNAWVLEKSRPMGEILVDQGYLAEDRKILLEALVQEHLKQHDNDPKKSLAAISSIKSVREDLEQLADPEVEASLVHISQNPDSIDPYATQPGGYSPGEPRVPLQRRFRILRPHAAGGLGQVSVALDEELHREVALKEIQPQHAGFPESRERFLLEAEVTGGLEHPGIVPVYGLGTYADGRPYYAMRFIQGDSLKTALEKFHQTSWADRETERGLELRKLLGRFIDVCNALAYAHSRGVLHRDLKPGNIMLGNYGETLVVDWGLAKLLSQQKNAGVSGQNTLVPHSRGSGETVEGSAIGTPQYMSPEQAAGKVGELGPQTDVYSLGATLFHILTGSPPFSQQDVMELLKHVQSGQFPAPREVAPTVAKPLEAICLKAMALQPSDRYSSPKELAEDMERWLGDEPVTAYRESFFGRLSRLARRHRTAVRIGMGALALITVIAIIAAFFVNAERKVAEQLADEKSKLAEQEQLARGKAEQLAGEKSILAQQEQNQRELAFDRLASGFTQKPAPDLEQEYFHTVLPWMAAAVETSKKANPARQSIYKTQWEFVRKQGPRLDHVWPGELEGFNPQGTRLLLSEWGKGVQVWDYKQREPISDWIKPEAVTLKLAEFDPLGKMVLTASPLTTDGYGKVPITFQTWDASTGKPLTQPFCPMSYYLCHEFRPDGEMLATIGVEPFGTGLTKDFQGNVYFNLWNDRRGTLKFWNPKTGKQLKSPLPSEILAHDVAMSPDSQHVAVVETYYIKPETEDPKRAKWNLVGELTVWEIATGKRVMEPIPVHPNASIAFSPDGNIIAGTGENSPNLRFWDWRTRQEVGTPIPYPTTGIDKKNFFTKDSQKVLVSGKLWKVREQKERQFVAVSVERFHKLTRKMSRDERRGVSFGKGQKGLDYARVVDLISHSKPVTTMVHHPGITDAQFAPNSRYLLTSGKGRTMQWDLAQQLLPALSLEAEQGSSSLWGDYSADGQKIATVSSRYIDGKPSYQLQLWDAKNARLLTDPVPIPHRAEFVKFSPDARWVLITHRMTAVGELGAASLWDAATGKLHGPTMNHSQGVQWADFNPTGDLVVTASRDNTARVWDVKSGNVAFPPLKHSPESEGKGGVCCAQFHPDGKLLATLSNSYSNGQVRFWNPRTGEVAGPKITVDGRPKQLAFRPDGKMLAVAAGKFVRLFEIPTGKELLPPLEHGTIVNQLSFDPTGTKLLTRSTRIHLWMVATRKPVTKSIRQAAGAKYAEFSPDGKWFLMCGYYPKTQGKIRGASYQTWLFDAHTADLIVRLGHYGGTISHSRFSPDSTRILITPMTSPAAVYEIPDIPIPAESVQNLSQLITGYYVDQVGGMYPADWSAEDYTNQWAALKKVYPKLFQATSKENLNWTRQELASCYQSGDYFSALQFAQSLQKQIPSSDEYRAVTAELLAAQGNWKKAAELLLLVIDSPRFVNNQGKLILYGNVNGSISVSLPELYALCLLHIPDEEQFAQYRKKLWKDFGDTQYGSTAMMLLELSVLGTWEEPDPRYDALIPMIQTNHRSYSHPLLHYRQGRFDQVVEELTKKHGKSPVKNLTLSKSPLRTPISDWFLLAMSLKKTGNPEEALAWHQLAMNSLKQLEPQFSNPRRLPSSWRLKAKWELLKRESSALFEPATKK